MDYKKFPLFVVFFMSIVLLCSCKTIPVSVSEEDTQVKDAQTIEYKKVSYRQALHASKMISPQSQGVASFAEYLTPLNRSITYLQRKKQTDTVLTLENRNVTVKTLLETAQHLRKLLPQLDKNPTLLAKDFDWYAVNPTILYTGYYEPLLNASRKQTKKYQYPIYATPLDLRVLQLGNFNPTLKGRSIVYRIKNGTPVPYYSRKEIDSDGVLKNRNLEIVWVDDLVDVFFLQIQGSGRLRFENGDESFILYAAQSGRPYTSVGSVMRARGLLEAGNVNMQTIRQWLYANPKEAQKILNTNESYVFFKEAKEGPFGSIGQIVTPWQSIAVDPRVLPYGSVGVMNVALPEKIQRLPKGTEHTRSISGFAFAQDTGGAIRKNRIDIFCGPSEEAVEVAGFLAGRNPYWMLIKKEEKKS